jgi:hypothetical protein
MWIFARNSWFCSNPSPSLGSKMEQGMSMFLVAKGHPTLKVKLSLGCTPPKHLTQILQGNHYTPLETLTNPSLPLKNTKNTWITHKFCQGNRLSGRSPERWQITRPSMGSLRADDKAMHARNILVNHSTFPWAVHENLEPQSRKTPPSGLHLWTVR